MASTRSDALTASVADVPGQAPPDKRLKHEEGCMVYEMPVNASVPGAVTM